MITTVENSVKIQKFKRKIQNRNRSTKDLTKARGRIMRRSDHPLLTGPIRRVFFAVIGKTKKKIVDKL